MTYVAIVVTLLGLSVGANDLNRCRPESAQDKKLYSSDLSWGQPFAQMMALYGRIYSSGKRLPKRAYWDAIRGGYFLPYEQGNGEPVPIDANFIGALRTHLEKGLRRKYADAVFFSDLGHSHMLIPLAKMPDYNKIPGDRLNELYTRAFADQDVRFLYHTAEQLDTSGGEPHLIWRQFNRNLVGENRTGGEVHVEAGYHENAHTLRDVAGYHWWSAGFNISASQDGCFPFQTPDGGTAYFDISLYDLESENMGGFGGATEPRWDRERCGPPSEELPNR